jgi:excinuclease ABC subunit C
MKQFYISRGLAPKFVLLPFELEDSELFSDFMEQQFGKRPHLRLPKRGDNARLVDLANKNALEEAERVTGKEEKITGTLMLLGKMLSMDPPKRIESYDISNISGTDIVAGMVVFEDGRPKKSDYKRFKLEGMANQDDYGSMRQTLTRRFQHYVDGDAGFETKPDLLLIDGGITHAQTAVEALQALQLDFPVFGMVKDDRHRTRALVTPDGREIAIDGQQAIFSFIGNIQEEVHRFAISYHRKLRSKRLRHSQMDDIPGIGAVRKQQLLRAFGSVRAIRRSTPEELAAKVPGLGEVMAQLVLDALGR